MEVNFVRQVKGPNCCGITRNAWKLKLIAIRAVFARWLWHAKVLVGIGLFFYVFIPVFLVGNTYIHAYVKSCSWVFSKLVFSHGVRWPPFVDPSHPSDFGLNSTRNFYLDVEPGIRIGAWHTLPAGLSAEREVPWEEYEETLQSPKLLFLYLHGNSGTRAAYHRMQMYKFMSRMGAHVLTVDYRGYGDSTGEPTEAGVVKDAYFAYKWLKEKSNGAPIFLWGHSLGTGISTHLARRLCDEGDPPQGLILESPFNNIVDAAYKHPFAFLFQHVPGFKSFIRDSAIEHNVHFSSDRSILKVTSHIMILHAEDDYVVPFDLGKQLYQTAKASRSRHTGDVEFISFEGHYGYGHKNIYTAPELRGVIEKFVKKASGDEKK